MTVRWSPDAVADLEKIVEYISTDDPAAARRVAESIYKQAEDLARFPRMGRIGRLNGTRELALPPLPFIVVYRFHVAHGTIEIVNVIHGAQLWPVI